MKCTEDWSAVRQSKSLEPPTRVTGEKILWDGAAEGHVGKELSKFNSRLFAL